MLSNADNVMPLLFPFQKASVKPFSLDWALAEGGGGR